MIDVDLKQQLGWLVIYILILSCLILLFIALFIFMIVEIPHLHTIWEALSINMLESISFFLSASLLTITVLIYSLRSTYLQNAKMANASWKSSQSDMADRVRYQDIVNDFKEHSRDLLAASALCFLSFSLFFAGGTFSYLKDYSITICAFLFAFIAVFVVTLRPIQRWMGCRYHWLLPGNPWGKDNY